MNTGSDSYGLDVNATNEELLSAAPAYFYYAVLKHGV